MHRPVKGCAIFYPHYTRETWTQKEPDHCWLGLNGDSTRYTPHRVILAQECLSSWLKNVSWGDKIMSKLYANEVRNDWRSMHTWVHLMGRPGEEQGDYAGKDEVIKGQM